MSYIKKLNENQKKAVTSDKKYLKIVAGAGSGKTRVLTSRIVYLIENGIPAHKILAITFTNKAAREMQERIADVLDNLQWKPRISTFHSFGARFLREESHLIDYPSNFNIMDDEDRNSILKEIFRDNNIAKDFLEIKTMNSYISMRKTYYYKNEYIANSGFNKEIEETKQHLFSLYEKKVKQMKSLDFDDLLLKPYEILMKNKEVLQKWQNRFEHILIDEFQDTNDLQFELVKLLTGNKNDLFVVGDPDQTIYTWRGANVNIINNLEKEYPGTETIILNTNYRSTNQILNIANKLIKNNPNRIHKDLKSSFEGDNIFYKEFENQVAEAHYVVTVIDNKVRQEGLKYSDFVILYRANYLSREFEKALIKRNINYRIYGGVGFYNRKEIKDALAYLKILVNKDDEVSLLRVINEPRRGIGDATIVKFRSIANKENITLYYAIKNYYEKETKGKIKQSIMKFINSIEKFSTYVDEISPSELLDSLMTEVSYYEFLETNNEFERIDNIKELVGDLFSFEQNNEDTSLDEFLQEVTLYSSQDEIEDGDHVSLMTIHTAKGLEFPHVFVISLCDGIFPSIRSVSETTYGMEEERRLAYVAFTRAEKNLYLTSNKGYSYLSPTGNKPSVFLYESLDAEQLLVSSTPTFFRGKQRTQPQPRKFVPIKKQTNDIAWSNGDTLNHKVFGMGVVLEVKDKFIKVAFKSDKVGVKTLIANHKSLSKL